MGFMQPQIEHGPCYVVETRLGTEVVPEDVVGSVRSITDLQMYCEGKVESFERRVGWLARMSAPGYMHCTPWSLHESREDAEASLREMYGDEDDGDEDDAAAL